MKNGIKCDSNENRVELWALWRAKIYCYLKCTIRKEIFRWDLLSCFRWVLGLETFRSSLNNENNAQRQKYQLNAVPQSVWTGRNHLVCVERKKTIYENSKMERSVFGVHGMKLSQINIDELQRLNVGRLLNWRPKLRINRESKHSRQWDDSAAIQRFDLFGLHESSEAHIYEIGGTVCGKWL